jgi:hypothetical protein
VVEPGIGGHDERALAEVAQIGPSDRRRPSPGDDDGDPPGG